MTKVRMTKVQEAHDGTTCTRSFLAGTTYHYDFTQAYAPTGERVLVSITTWVHNMTGTGGGGPCPGAIHYDDGTWSEYCYTVSFEDHVVGTDVHSVRIVGGQPNVSWPVPGDVFWLGLSEDGATVASGEGAVATTSIWRPGNGPGAYRNDQLSYTLTDCAIWYRNAATGTAQPSDKIPSTDACAGPQGQGTIAPAPKQVGSRTR